MSCEIMKKTGCSKQIASLRKIVFDDGPERGVRAVEVNTGGGLYFTILTDRGMDIGEAFFNGKSLAWLSPTGFRAPQFFEHRDAEFLRNFGGGLLTGTGLRNVGAPNIYRGESLALHGRLSNTPAFNVACSEEWVDGKLILTVRGSVREVRVFGENLLLTRTIRCIAGENEIELTDKIENQGTRPSHAGILYHINLGWPLIDETTRIVAAKHPVTPRDEAAANGLGSWDICHEPLSDYVEQCFYHDLSAGKDGMTEIHVENEAVKMGFSISSRKKELPFLTQWKQFGSGEYVLGLEPGTSHVEGTAAEDEKYNNLKVLKSGESFETLLRLKAKTL